MHLIWVMWKLALEYQRLGLLIKDVLLLIVPDSVHTMHTPITLGTLHIEMAIKLATKKELENLNKPWMRSLIVTKLTMKEV